MRITLQANSNQYEQGNFRERGKGKQIEWRSTQMNMVICLPRFGSKEPSPRWGGHKGRVYSNPFPLSIGHTDWLSDSPWSLGSLRPCKDHHTLRCLLLALQGTWRIRVSRKKAIQATRATNETLNTLSQVTKQLSWFWGLERIWSFDCVLECRLLLLYWMWRAENLDSLNGGG
jgi:hypothetical protein